MIGTRISSGTWICLVILVVTGCGPGSSVGSALAYDDRRVLGGWSCTDGAIHRGSPTTGFYLFSDGTGVLYGDYSTDSITWVASSGYLTIYYTDIEEGLDGQQGFSYSIDEERNKLIAPDDPFMFGCDEMSRADLRLVEWEDETEDQE